MDLKKRWNNLKPLEIHALLLKKGPFLNQSVNKKGTAKREIDLIKEQHKFLWEDGDAIDTWEKQLAKKYYDRLFKEYCIGDLTCYKENKVGLRWRIEKELVSGKGQFTCGEKYCESRKKLRTWEVNFAYSENGLKKNALVKLRLCPKCSEKLNYHHKRKEVKRLKKRGKLKEISPAREIIQSEEDPRLAETSSTTENIWSSDTQIPKASNDVNELDSFLDDLFL